MFDDKPTFAALKQSRAIFRRANQTPLPLREGLGEGLGVHTSMHSESDHSRQWCTRPCANSCPRWPAIRGFRARPIQRGTWLAPAALALLVLGGCAGRSNDPSSSAGPSGPGRSQPRKTTKVHRVSGPIAIDAQIDEPAWDRAEKLIVNEHYPPKEPGAPRIQDVATARLLWDQEYLYFAFEMRDRDVWCSYTQRDEPLAREDVIELFVKPRPDSNVYYEFEINPLGVVFDLCWPKRSSRSDNWAKQWNGNVQLATRVEGTLEDFTDEDQGWVVEGKIPFSDFRPPLSGPPAEGERWRGNVCRYNYGVDLTKTELATWSPNQDAAHGFHRFEDYGNLIFVR